MLGPRRESHMIEKTSSCNGTSSAMRRDWSHVRASSTPGAIRVIHIFAPKVIKTDVANFRALVQKLTGKSTRGAGSGGKKRSGDSAALRTTSSMRSSSDATFSSSTDTITIQSSSTAAETYSDSSTRPSNSDRSPLFLSSPDPSSTSSASASVKRFFGLPSSFSSSQPHNQMLPAEISFALFRTQSCTTASSSSNSINSNYQSSSSSSSDVVDPLQSLSGYKDSWQKPQASSCKGSFNFSSSINDQNPGTATEQQQQPCQNQIPKGGGPHNVSTLNLAGLSGLAFSDMDILTGLVSPEPLPEFSLPPPLINYNNINISCNNSTPTLTPEHFVLSNHHPQPSVNCRLSVQPLLRGSVSPFERF